MWEHQQTVGSRGLSLCLHKGLTPPWDKTSGFLGWGWGFFLVGVGVGGGGRGVAVVFLVWAWGWYWGFRVVVGSIRFS